MSLATTTLAQRYMENLGYRCDIVERHITKTVTHDLFGIFDLVAIKPNETIGIQATTKPNISARIKKLTDAEAIGDVREAGWTIWVMAFTPGAKEGDEPRIEDLS